jgi:hypothetical protein
VAIQRDLARAFPDYPIYGGGQRFVPHVTIAEGSKTDALASDPAWRTLPVRRSADRVELLVREAGVWRGRLTLPLR